MIIRPMLAAKLDEYDLEHNIIPYPVLCTPKIDGIRCIIVEGQALSRSFKPIANDYIRQTIEKYCPTGFDGELITFTNGKMDSFNTVQSKVMSYNGTPDFQYWVFDYVVSDAKREYSARMVDLKHVVVTGFVRKIIPQTISNKEELLVYEESRLAEGYEGVMLRVYDGGYKSGRSTLRQFWLVKLKRFTDSEAVVLSTEQLMRNTNDAEISPTGYTVRRKTKDGQVEDEMMGRCYVRDLKSGVEFYVGSGFTDAERMEDNYVGRIMTYKHLSHGMKDKPRHPIFMHWRLPE